MRTRISSPIVDFSTPTSHPASCRPLLTSITAIICEFLSAVVCPPPIGWTSICTFTPESPFLFDPPFLCCNLALLISAILVSYMNFAEDVTYSSRLIPDNLLPLLPYPLFLLMLMSLPFLRLTLLLLPSKFLIRLQLSPPLILPLPLLLIFQL
jgi:hypothetical protein